MKYLPMGEVFGGLYDTLRYTTKGIFVAVVTIAQNNYLWDLYSSKSSRLIDKLYRTGEIYLRKALGKNRRGLRIDLYLLV